MDYPAYATVLNPIVFPSAPPSNDIKMEVITANDNGNAEDPSAVRKPWKRPGAPVVKVAPDVKRRRRNYQARKLLMPKNPLMILNELKTGILYNFVEKSNEVHSTYFEASVEVDGQTFSGCGTSKKQAQQEAAEAALRGLYFDKLLDQLMKKEDDVEMKDFSTSTDSQADGTAKFQVPEDDTPWSGLASLAMFKLVSLWQSPNTTGMQAPVTNKPPTTPLGGLLAKLPLNPTSMDPVMLLNQISPHSKFTEETRDVRSGATFFTISVDFNGVKYVGSATRKRVAKKMCAKSALKSLGVEYSDDQ